MLGASNELLNKRDRAAHEAAMPRREGNAERHRRTGVRRALHAEQPIDLRRPFAHARQAEPSGRCRCLNPRPSSLTERCCAIAVEPELDANVRRLSMTNGVGHRLLRDAEDVLFDFRLQAPNGPRCRDVDCDLAVLAEIVSDTPEARQQIATIEILRMQVPDRPMRLRQVRLDEPRAFSRFRLARRRLVLNGRQIQPDGREALRQRVVNLAGDSVRSFITTENCASTRRTRTRCRATAASTSTAAARARNQTV